MSDYVEHNSVFTRFEVGQSWAILSPIEQSIKRKIEAVGKPLKDWDVKIYRGILTGCNEAFIIDGTKKDELIAKDPKSAEIIRPILRGKDIKRYGYDFHDKWLITTHNGLKEKNIPPVDVTKYPSIKAHLDQFYPQLAKRQDKGDTPYNLRNCAYMEDFNKQKIIYPDIMRMPRSVDSLTKYPYFYFDKEGYFVEATNFMMNGNDINVIYSFINSDLGFYIFSKFYSGPQFDNTGFRYKKEYLQNMFFININEDDNKNIADTISNVNFENYADIYKYESIINSIFEKYIHLSEKEKKIVAEYKYCLLHN